MSITLYTLDVDDYAPAITTLTFPYLRAYAEKLGAEFVVIRDRCFRSWPVNMEKFQIGKMAQAKPADWHLFFDADTLIHPDTPDWTAAIPKDTVAHNGADFAPVRWKGNRYFQRDGRHIGSCTWCVMASDWTVADLWASPTLSLEDSLREIQPTLRERNAGVDAAHLLDDYWLSRNIARYGLKFTTLIDHERRSATAESQFFWHAYAMPMDQKVAELKTVLARWGLA